MPHEIMPAQCWEHHGCLGCQVLGMEHCRLSQGYPWGCCRKTTGKEALLLAVFLRHQALTLSTRPPPVPPPYPWSSVVSTPATPPWPCPHVPAPVSALGSFHILAMRTESRQMRRGLEAEPGARGPLKERGAPEECH